MVFPIETNQLVKLEYAGTFLSKLLGRITLTFPTPAIWVAFVSGVLLNPIWADLLAGLGRGLGEIRGYLAGYGGKLVIENKELYERVRPWITRNGFITYFVLVVLPKSLFDLEGITAGTMGYLFLKFMVATIFGKMFKVLAFLGLESSKLLGP